MDAGCVGARYVDSAGKEHSKASATTTLNTYSHLWPDADESTRATVGAVIADRSAAYWLRTGGSM